MTERPLYFAVALCILGLLLGMQVKAQQYNFRNWTLEQGLPQSQVNDILQDHSGHLWFATRGGVSRFNGQQFYTFTTSEGLSSNNISVLYQDKQKNIWIGTSDKGLMQYDGVRFIAHGPKQGLKANIIYDISSDDTGRVWIATEAGMFYFKGGKFARYTSLPAQPYKTVLAATNNILWAGSQAKGLYRVSPSGISRYTTRNSQLPSNHITALYRHTPDALWIGTAAGAAKLANDSTTRLTLPVINDRPLVSGFVHDDYGNIWIGLQQNGLVKYDGKKYTYFTRYNGLRTKRINALTRDKEGNIWLGTNGYGVQQLTSPWFVHFFEFGEISEPRVTAVTTDTQGRTWMGTDEGNMANLANGKANWLPKPAWPDGTAINHIAPLNDTSIWVATNNGVWHITPTTSIKYATANGLPANEVYQCVAAPDSSIWMATAKGVARLLNDSIYHYKHPKNQQPGRVYTLHVDCSNQIWAGAANGVYKLKGNQLVKAPELAALKLEEVLTIAEDRQGVLYFGAFNHGVAAHNTKWAKPKLFTRQDGLPNEGIKSLFVDAGDNLWIGTSRNVLKVFLPQLRQNKEINYNSYSSANGFRGIEISQNAIAQTPDGALWFGTTKGITKYMPTLDKRNKVYPKVALTDILLYQKPTDWQQLGYTTDTMTGLPQNLRLPHTQNHLTFDFHAICLSGPEQVRYKYKLIGYDDYWSPATDQAFATFPNLNPGTYTFELLAQNNDGYWTPRPLTYTFSIVPPIWRREWFIGVLLLVIAGAVLSIVKLRERSLVKMNTLLEMRVNHRTRLLERKNREKEMLLQEIHHRVKNNLQIVISMLNLQARHVQDQQSIDVMRALKSRVRSMAILHERLYRHDDIGEIDLDDYFRGICESLYEAYGVTEKQVLLEMAVPPIKVDIDRAITLGLIVNELVSNALKYAFADLAQQTGVLRIVLQPEHNSRYTLTVSDNGKGLPFNFEQKMKSSFGLQLVSSLSKKLNGKIEFERNNGTKSILSFVLPS